MRSFLVPPEIEFKECSLDYLEQLEAEKAVIVTDENLEEKINFLDQALNMLEKAGVETLVVDRVATNPSVKTVLQGKEAMLDFDPDWIIALGEGSIIDAAKIMWSIYKYPDLMNVQI